MIFIYNVNDENYKNSKSYLEFLDKNPESGTLKIRAYAANQALPIKGLKVVVSTIIDKNVVIFYEGLTNESGIIENIILPAPKINSDNMIIPNSIIYEIKATYVPDNIEKIYSVRIYENVYVVQNINIIPSMKIEEGGINGS